MCRIGGLWLQKGELLKESLPLRLAQMAALQSHGGPDGEGFWYHPTKPLGFLHRRLAIIDLSPAGAQPMQREQMVITYNGEVYNYAELRRKLIAKGYVFQSSTDTEVLLWGWREWGVSFLHELRGMFAFGFWDGEALYLVRDRFGVKPLFYASTQGEVVFASELPALLVGLSVKPPLNIEALPSYLAYGFLKSPLTMYEGIRQVPPGAFLKVTEGGVELHKWWDPKPFFFFAGPKVVPEEVVEETLYRSFERRLVADVPVGIFLSGGIDSSLLAALLAKKGQYHLPSFTIGFSDEAYDEAPWAQRIAEYLDLPHYVLYVDEKELLNRVERLPLLYGQPFGDASALAVEVLAEFARQRVKVALSADGGDELFGGYVRQRESATRLKWAARLLRLLWRSPAQAARFLPSKGFHNFQAKLFKLYYYQGQSYGELIQAFPEWLIRKLFLPELSPSFSEEEAGWQTSLSARQYIDLTTYLPDDVLQKVDRATMYHALEAREPFLDPEIVQLSASLPEREKRGKHILRRILSKYLPPVLWKRPKQGFAPPVSSWLLGPLRERLESFIYQSKSPLYEMGLRRAAVEDFYKAFVAGEQGAALLFWHLLILGLWAEWYATISPASGNLYLAKNEPA
ncbi:MAG: asparagine synthase (glutamine-hydrolyzing) [Bacteroidia bacterium]|nr:asparagine synthase (glutamine-hydrolyzing) [Bacteroidia bacterium]MCX7764887.1 asparagine synthase (glutamine-hydrolyzing) [Bacteroidia bacterium]MDW8058233.1 asparagine synthase (glutamine-hydrolyzing) [Bacteroidia bacterium]